MKKKHLIDQPYKHLIGAQATRKGSSSIGLQTQSLALNTDRRGMVLLQARPALYPVKPKGALLLLTDHRITDWAGSEGTFSGRIVQ